MATRPTFEELDHLQRSERDTASIPSALASWLTDLLPAGADPTVTVDAGIDSNGMSSETVMLTGRWTENGTVREQQWVMRMQPRPADIPVFAEYHLDRQFEAMRLAAELTGLPVPTTRWLEPTGDILGSPFFLMDRVAGLVPPDVMPYTFGDNWFFDAPADKRRQLQDATIDVIATLHAIPDARTTFDFLDPHADTSSTPLRRRLDELQRFYDFAAADLGRSPLLDRAMTWLDANFPDELATGETVLNWGDARIGNVIYQDFEPAAILDWEMATLGPRELDVAWLIFAHNVFQELVGLASMPGLPDVLREEDVRATYRELTGVDLGDLGWFYLYSAVLWGVIFMRTASRRIHFGEMARPTDIEAELFYHRPLLQRLLDDRA